MKKFICLALMALMLILGGVTQSQAIGPIQSCTTPLGGGATFTGSWYNISDFAQLVITANTDQSGTAYIDQGNDGATAAYTTAIGITGSTPLQAMVDAIGTYARLRVVNGATPETTVQVNLLGKIHPTPTFAGTATLGVATATTLNKVTITTPATGSTLTIADGKTLTASNILTLAGTDSTTMTFPAASGKVMTSTLTTNSPTVANSVWGVSNGLKFEGVTADANETTITVVDPTGTRTVTLPDASGYPILSTAAPAAAHSVSAANDAVVFEGATADAYHTNLTVTDPTATRTVTLPDASGVPILSTAVPAAAHAVSGANDALVFEGATADAYNTTLTVADPTASRTITLPNATGTTTITGTGGGISHNYAGSNTEWDLTAVEAEATYISTTNAGTGTANAILASCRAGKIYYLNNTSGQSILFKVTSQSGATVATAKMATFVCNGTDVLEGYVTP